MSFIDAINPFTKAAPAYETDASRADSALGGDGSKLFMCEIQGAGGKEADEIKQRRRHESHGKMASGMDPAQDPAIAASLNPQMPLVESTAEVAPKTATATVDGLKV